MMKKLLWPATLLAAFALPAACGGGSTDSDMGGAGGSDGSGGDESTGGNDPTGGRSTGGGAGEGGQGGSGSGGGPVVEQPETCSDGDQNEMETDVDCGGPDCDPCEDDAACRQPSDCDSGVCSGQACATPDCGDGVTNGDEECDDTRDTPDCDENCTLVECGDGYVNETAEVCEPDPNLPPWQRCGKTCVHGVDLDGTWRTNGVPGGVGPWEILPAMGSFYIWLPTFHYLVEPSIVELRDLKRFDIKGAEWLPVGVTGDTPARPNYSNGAPDGALVWVVIGTTMYTFDVVTEVWTPHTLDLPNADDALGSGVVHDGDGYLWFVGLDGVESVLVKFDPADGGVETFSWAIDTPGFQAYLVNLAYDPIGDKIVLASYYYETAPVIFDLATETFSMGNPLPDGGHLSGGACQDRAGGVYVLSRFFQGYPSYSYVANGFRYDVATNTYAPLPALPFPHDSLSGCTVSEAGYLYYGASGQFARLRLNHR